jgi:PIN like domain
MNQLQPTTFFIDRCLGTKAIVEALREINVSVEIHDDHFMQGALDVDWLPEVGSRGWVILTKDARIGKNQIERMAVASANIRMFVLASQNLSGSDMADAFVLSMSEMKRFISLNSAPFIAKIYAKGAVKQWKNSSDLIEEYNNYFQ